MDRRGRVRSPARAGALLSRLAGGPVLLIAWIVPVVVGLRVVQPIGEEAREKGTERRHDRALLTAVTFLTGIFTGLLANGGGFLLVPIYLLLFGLRMRQAVGTSLLVITVLAVPTPATHWALGHINWALAGEFALGQVPGSAVGSQFAHRVQGPVSAGPSGGSSRLSGWCSPSTGSPPSGADSSALRSERHKP